MSGIFSDEVISREQCQQLSIFCSQHVVPYKPLITCYTGSVDQYLLPKLCIKKFRFSLKFRCKICLMQTALQIYEQDIGVIIYIMTKVKNIFVLKNRLFCDKERQKMVLKSIHISSVFYSQVLRLFTLRFQTYIPNSISSYQIQRFFSSWNSSLQVAWQNHLSLF